MPGLPVSYVFHDVSHACNDYVFCACVTTKKGKVRQKLIYMVISFRIVINYEVYAIIYATKI